MTLDPIAQRQLQLGAASWFRPETETPPGNQIIVKAGFAFRGAFAVEDRFTAGDQTTTGFGSVSLGFKRYDLVHMDATGLVQILPGNQVAVAAPVFDGAPGYNLGPDLPDQAVPVAYVFVDEVGAVTVSESDITQITGFLPISRDLNGYQVDKGLLGAAPSGTSDVVTALFASDVPQGSDTQRGAVTVPPLNFVAIVDQAGNELIRTADGSQVYGRLIETGAPAYPSPTWVPAWALGYFANVAGVETAVDVDTDITTSPTDIRLIGVPVVFSQNDPTRPLFASSIARLSDLAAADIPTATLTVQGKALAGPTGPAIPVIGTVNTIRSAGAPVGGGPFHQLDFSGGVAAGPAGVAVVNLAAGAPGPTGPTGPTGVGGPGPTGPGFSSLGAWSQSASVSNGALAPVFNYGFTVRMYAPCLSQVNTGAFGPGNHNLNSAFAGGTAVTINFNHGGCGNTRVGCVAAG